MSLLPINIFDFNRYDITKLKLNRMETVATTEGTTTYSYYGNGNRKTILLPNGTLSTYYYDKRNLLTKLLNKVCEVETTYEYGYNAEGLQIYKSEPIGRTDFLYDDLDRVKIVTEPGGRVTTYTYDKAGNRNAQTIDAPGLDVDISYTYNGANRLTQTVKVRNSTTTSVIYEYDDNGNQTKVTENGTSISNYTYNKFNRLKTVATADGQVVTNKYNAFGQRVEKTAGGITTTYYDVGGNIILEVDSNGRHTRNIQGINLIGRNYGGGILYYLYNGHGDVTQIVGNAGNVVNSYQYDEWGNILSQTEGVDNPFKYCGEYFDKETGLYYLRARYYDPVIGRFISEDSYPGKDNDPLSLNLYTYCWNNPVLCFLRGINENTVNSNKSV